MFTKSLRLGASRWIKRLISVLCVLLLIASMQVPAHADTDGSAVSAAPESSHESPVPEEDPPEAPEGSEPADPGSGSPAPNTPSPSPDPEATPNNSIIQPLADIEWKGPGGIRYEIYESSKTAWIANNQATLTTRNIVIPREINYNGTILKVVGVRPNAFRNLTGLTFEEPSNVYSIGTSAFAESPDLTGILTIPDSVTEIGAAAFESSNYSRIIHKKVLHIDPSFELPKNERPALIPESDLKALDYESIVDSSDGNYSLRKSAKWTNTGLNEAEIRIEYGENDRLTADADFIFIMDYSGSMQNQASARAFDNGITYNFPRFFLMHDIVQDAAKFILDDSFGENTSRVGLVAFGGVSPTTHSMQSLLWTQDFSNDPTVIRESLLDHPAIAYDPQTDYTAGIKGAGQLISARDADDDSEFKNRKTFIFFLSDGAPRPLGSAVNEAQILKNKGANIYSIGMFLSTGDFNNAQATLKSISSNNKMYEASNAAKLEECIVEALEDAMYNFPIKDSVLEDTLSEHFTFETGNVTDADASAGTVSISGDKISWDLDGCNTGEIHTLTIKVKLSDASRDKTGSLPTNSGMGVPAKDLTSGTQPRLSRYLAEYQFVNGKDASETLPAEVLALLPATSLHRDGTEVTANGPAQRTVTTGAGEIWDFSGWDADPQTIQGDNILCSGAWNPTSGTLRLFKTNSTSAGLEGAEFQLFKAGTDWSQGDEVTGYTIKTDSGGYFDFTSLPFGNYILIETRAPEGYNLLADPVLVYFTQSGQIVTVTNIRQYTLPATGGDGTTRLYLTGTGLLVLALCIALYRRE